MIIETLPRSLSTSNLGNARNGEPVLANRCTSHVSDAVDKQVCLSLIIITRVQDTVGILVSHLTISGLRSIHASPHGAVLIVTGGSEA